MKKKNEEFPKHACQFCGCERKLVETFIDDELVWNEVEQAYQPNGFTDILNIRGLHGARSVRRSGLGHNV